MNSQETSDNSVKDDGTGKEAEQGGDDALASKLSKELNNWRRRRTTGRTRPAEAAGPGKFQSEPARTIKVRGHETLVIRKAKIVTKPRVDSNPTQD